MAILDCDLRGFSSGNGRQDLDISLVELVHHTVTAGLPLMSSSSRYRRTLLDQAWRVAAVLSTVERKNLSTRPTWCVSEGHRRREATEKVVASYILGMVQAQVTCTRLLGLTHLVHLSFVRGLTLTPAARPDFLGFDSAGMVSASIEAKGRTSALNSRDIAKAKSQASSGQVYLAGASKSMAVASLSWFDRQGNWRARLEDPEPSDAVTEIGMESALLGYYRPFIEAASEFHGSGRPQPNYVIPGYGIEIVIDPAIFEACRRSQTYFENSDANSSFLTRSVQELGPRGGHDQGFFWGNDGIGVRIPFGLFEKNLDETEKLDLWEWIETERGTQEGWGPTNFASTEGPDSTFPDDVPPIPK